MLGFLAFVSERISQISRVVNCGSSVGMVMISSPPHFLKALMFVMHSPLQHERSSPQYSPFAACDASYMHPVEGLQPIVFLQSFGWHSIGL